MDKSPTVSDLLAALSSSTDSKKSELLQVAVKAAVDEGLLPKSASTDDYIRSWDSIERVLVTFLNSANERL